MVRDSWKTYERNGWHFEGDEMVSPPNQENYYVNRQGIYVPGQGPHANAKSVQERIELSDTGQKRKQPSTDDSAA
jgi:hypothetical protein